MTRRIDNCLTSFPCSYSLARSTIAGRLSPGSSKTTPWTSTWPSKFAMLWLKSRSETKREKGSSNCNSNRKCNKKLWSKNSSLRKDTNSKRNEAGKVSPRKMSRRGTTLSVRNSRRRWLHRPAMRRAVNIRKWGPSMFRNRLSIHGLRPTITPASTLLLRTSSNSQTHHRLPWGISSSKWMKAI